MTVVNKSVMPNFDLKNKVITIILVEGKVIPVNHWITVHNNITVNQCHCSSLYLFKSLYGPCVNSHLSSKTCLLAIPAWSIPYAQPLWITVIDGKRRTAYTVLLHRFCMHWML